MAPPPPEFQFMNISNIEDANTRQNRSTVRSHITRRQHRLAKQKKTGGTRPGDGDHEEVEFLPVRLSSSIADHSSVIGRPTNSSRKKKRPPNARKAGGGGAATAAGPASEENKLVARRAAANMTTLARSSHKIPPHPNNGKADPFDCYPVPYQPWFDPVLHHMMTIYAPRGWPALSITPAQGLSWERYMTQQALSEPALFYVRLLFASGDMIRLHLLPRATATWLQYHAVRALNDALGDPVRAASDAVILAVGRIAWHESLYGDRTACTYLHRPAQARLIAARGGFEKLEFPPLVKRLMCLTDEIMARQSGSQRYFTLPPATSAPTSPEKEDGRGSGRVEEVLSEADEEQQQEVEFTPQQKSEVLHSWVPPEAQTPTPGLTPPQSGSVAGSVVGSRTGSISGSVSTTPGSVVGESHNPVASAVGMGASGMSGSDRGSGGSSATL